MADWWAAVVNLWCPSPPIRFRVVLAPSTLLWRPVGRRRGLLGPAWLRRLTSGDLSGLIGCSRLAGFFCNLVYWAVVLTSSRTEKNKGLLRFLFFFLGEGGIFIYWCFSGPTRCFWLELCCTQGCVNFFFFLIDERGLLINSSSVLLPVGRITVAASTFLY